MADINSASWSEQDNLNNSVPPAGWPEGMMPSGVNDSGRAVMGAIKRWYDRIGATVISGGSANAQTLTYAVPPTALAKGDTFSFVPGFTNTGPATLNVGTGAITLVANGQPLVGGELAVGIPATAVYDGGGYFSLVGGEGKFLRLTGGTLSGPLVVNGGITTTGPGGIFSFADRGDNSKTWAWYATAGLARLYYAPIGDRVTFDINGNITLGGTFLNFASGAAYYSADATNHVARLGTGAGGFYWQKADGTTLFKVDVAGNLFTPGNYLCFAGSIGGAGPYYYGDANNLIMRLGTGNGGWYFQNSGGTPFAVIGGNAGGPRLLLQNGSGQNTASLNTVGTLSNAIMLDDTGVAAGSGGVIIFSANNQAWRYAAIMGSVQDGSNNSRGDIVFSVRPLNTDATLSEAMRIKFDKSVVLQSPYLYQSGSSGFVNSTGGPMIYADAGNSVIKLGSSNGNVVFQNYSGSNFFYVTAAGELYANASLHAGNSLYLGGQFIFWGAGVAPWLQVDGTNWWFRMGTGNGYYNFQSNNGTVCHKFGVNGDVFAMGVSAIYWFDDRTGGPPSQWGLYATSGQCRLYNNSSGDVVIFGNDGTIYPASNVVLPVDKYVFCKDSGGTPRRTIGIPSSNNNIYIGDGLRSIYATASVYPDQNNVWSCGVAGNGWAQVAAYSHPVLSDRRQKTDLENLPDGCLELVNRLRPQRFRYTVGPAERQAVRHCGFVAQDVGEVLPPDLGCHIAGEAEMIDPHALTAILWKACQEMSARIATLEARV